jgi:hypothetical protein
MTASRLTRVRAVSGTIAVLVVAAGMLLASAVPANAIARTTRVAPNPAAPHSGKSIPGISGAAAHRLDSPESPDQRRAELAAAGSRRVAPAVPSAVTPNLPTWSGAFHGYWGTFPSVVVSGAQATQSVNPRVQLGPSDPDTLYSPTLYPTGAGCIEATTIYAYDTTNKAPGIWVGAWDWCGTRGFQVRTPVDASFLSTYTVAMSGQDYYTVQDVLTDSATNTWTAYLYNYQTATWDTLYTSSGSSGGTNLGWAMDEVYTNYNSGTGEGFYCSESYGANWETYALSYQIGGQWVAADSANSGTNLAYPRGSDLGCATDSFWLPTANANFKVTNNTHGPGELVGTGSGRCVDTNGNVFADGTKEQIWDCNHAAGETWTYNSLGELTVDNGQYCLDATGQGTANGTRIQLWRCLGGANQEWTLSIKHTIVGIQSGKCLDVTSYGTANGTPLQLWTCNATTNQQWTW